MSPLCATTTVCDCAIATEVRVPHTAFTAVRFRPLLVLREGGGGLLLRSNVVTGAGVSTNLSSRNTWDYFKFSFPPFHSILLREVCGFVFHQWMKVEGHHLSYTVLNYLYLVRITLCSYRGQWGLLFYMVVKGIWNGKVFWILVLKSLIHKLNALQCNICIASIWQYLLCRFVSKKITFIRFDYNSTEVILIYHICGLICFRL